MSGGPRRLVAKPREDYRAGGRGAAPTIGELILARYSRRSVLGGLAVGLAGTLAGGWTEARGGETERDAAAPRFTELGHGLDASDRVAPGYRNQVVIRWGDPVSRGAPAFDPAKQSAANQSFQFGYNCDFIAYLPMPFGSRSSEHGLLCVNHEYTQAYLMFPGVTKEGLERQGLGAAETRVEQSAHGHSIVEVQRHDGRWYVLEGSSFSRRITAWHTRIGLSGPAAGSPRLVTSADATGREVIGTLGDCAGGVTPWHTVLIGEENFDSYFDGDPAGTPETANHLAYGVGTKPHHPWWRRYDRRFDVAAEPHEPNRFGWVVEIDPYDPGNRSVKRTALGRFKHEGATTALAADGRVAVYSGDDEAFQFVYRFVTRRAYDPESRFANRDLLDEGVLSVARFDADGTLVWLPLLFGEGPLTPANGFRNQADVLIETRRAAALLGATPMDRPEDVEANPVSGKVYVMLSNNRKRAAAQSDAANPRGPNPDGHILELVPPAISGVPDHGAERYRWEIFLLAGDPRDPAGGARYHPGVSADGWFSAPDNCAFDSRGRMWIATDGSPKRGIADGIYGTAVEGPLRALTKHLYRVPRGAEATGPAFTPDDTTLFVSVQHPGADSQGYDTPTTRWPDFRDDRPPRPSVVAISREDGGPVGG